MIEARALTKRYGDKTAVDNLGFTVRPGVVTGFLGPNGAGKSTTMRMIVGLDAPTAGSVTVNGRRYAEHAAPLHEVGALLEARAVHTGRTATNHLLAMAATAGIGRRRVAEVIELVGLGDVADKRAGAFSLGMGQRLGIASALLGDPATLLLDEPVNGLDPDGILWVRTLLRGLADEGRTVFLSSHLMSEMEMTADHLIVVGRGRLLRDMSLAEFIADSGGNSVRVRTPQASQLRGVLLDADVTVSPTELSVRGLTAEEIGTRAAAASITLYELTPVRSSLEEAYMEITRESVEYRGGTTADITDPVDQQDRRMSTETLSPPTPSRSRAPIAGPVTFGGLVRSEWIKFRSLRSSWYTLGAAAAAMVVLGFLIGYEVGRNPVGLDVEDTVASATLQGYALAQLLIGVLGALFVTGEYGTGAIRSSLVAAPRRTPVLMAKFVVFGAIALVTMVVASVLAFLAGEAVLSHYGTGFSLGDPTALRVSVGTGVYLTLLGLLGSAFGWIVRRTAGAISALLGLLLIAPAVFGNLLGTWGKDVAKFLPSGGESFIHSYTAPNTLAPWTGLAVTIAWVAVTTVVAAIQLRRRDA